MLLGLGRAEGGVVVRVGEGEGGLRGEGGGEVVGRTIRRVELMVGRLRMLAVLVVVVVLGRRVGTRMRGSIRSMMVRGLVELVEIWMQGLRRSTDGWQRGARCVASLAKELDITRFDGIGIPSLSSTLQPNAAAL